MKYFIAYYLLAPIVLYIFFRIVMKFKGWGKEGKLNKFTYGIGIAILWMGWIIDFLVNVSHSTFLFFIDLPKEATVTHKLKRIRAESQVEWKKKIAIKLLAHLAKHDKWGGHD